MNNLNFGTAGIPLSTPNRSTLNGIRQVKKLGLDAMELEFVRSVNITEEKAPLVKKISRDSNVILTCHGQYYVNMNAKDPAKLKASIQRVLLASNRAWQCGAWSICFHMAYYMGDRESVAYEKTKEQVKTVVRELKNTGNEIWLRAETGGKVTQFADIEDLIRLSQEVEQVLPCIDWAHHCSRSNGKVNSYEEFKNILVQIESGLGTEAIRNMHMHIEGIEWSEKGERNHLKFEDSKFKYQDALRAVKDFNVKGVMICESPNIEEDAIIAREFYAR
jgi:deoxyribonuclease IV